MKARRARRNGEDKVREGERWGRESKKRIES